MIAINCVEDASNASVPVYVYNTVFVYGSTLIHNLRIMHCTNIFTKLAKIVDKV